jgi:surface antigen
MAASALQAYAYGNCTYYVAKRFPGIYPYLGNAAQWVDNARKVGYQVLTKPAAGTVAVWGVSKISPLGHVAVVDSVNADGSFNVSEMNNPYTPGGGYNLIDQRRSTGAGVIGFIVPPGSLYGAASSQQQVTQACVTGSITIPAVPLSGNQPTTICFDGLVGFGVMVGGGVLIIGGLAVFAAFALKDTPIGRAASSLPLIASGPAGAAVAASTRSNAPRAKPSVETDQAAAAASASRVATAKSRVYTDKSGERYEVNLEGGENYGKRRKMEAA